MLVLLLRDGVGVSNETVDNALVLFVDEPCLTEVSVEIKVPIRTATVMSSSDKPPSFMAVEAAGVSLSSGSIIVTYLSCEFYRLG